MSDPKPETPILNPLHGVVTPENLREYKTNLAYLNQVRSKLMFQNGMVEHAAAILEEFFRSAEKSVSIFCHDLNDRVYDQPELYNQLLGALSRNVKVDVICQKTPASKRLPALAAAALEQGLPFRIIVGKLPETDKTVANFAVMDGRAFRWEHDHTRMEALGCMNSTKVATELQATFDQFWKAENAAA